MHCYDRALPSTEGGGVLRSCVLLLIISTVFLLNACSPSSAKPRYVWPVPPDQPEIEFIQNVYFPHDMNPGKYSVDEVLQSGEEPIFETPFDLLAYEDGHIVISDSRAGFLWVLSADGKVAQIPVGETQLKFPLGLARGNSGNIYVAEGQGQRIAEIDNNGRVSRYIGEHVFSGNPSFLAMDKRRNYLYASDTSRHHIEVFSLDGHHLRTIGEPGMAPGQLAAPQGLAVNERGELFVAEMLNSRISVFDATGNFLRVIPFEGWGPYVFNSPKGLKIGPGEKLWATDQRLGALVAFDSEEKPWLFVGAGHMSDHPMAFGAPSGLDITSGGALWVSDFLLRRLEHWQELTPKYMRSHPFSTETLKRLALYEE